MSATTDEIASKFLPSVAAMRDAFTDAGFEALLAASRYPDRDPSYAASRVALVAAGSPCTCEACQRIRSVMEPMTHAAGALAAWRADDMALLKRATADIRKDQVPLADLLNAILGGGRVGVIRVDDDDDDDSKDGDGAANTDGNVASAPSPRIDAADAVVRHHEGHTYEVLVTFRVDAPLDTDGWPFASALAQAMLASVPDRALVTLARTVLATESVIARNLEMVAAHRGEDYAADDTGFPYVAAFRLVNADGVATPFVLDVDDLATKRAALAAAQEELARWAPHPHTFVAGQGLFPEAGFDRTLFRDYASITPEQAARHVRAWILYGPGAIAFSPDNFAGVRRLPPGEAGQCATLAVRYGWADTDRIAQLDKEYAIA